MPILYIMNKFNSVWSTIFGVSSSEYSGFKGLVYVAIICSMGLVLVNYLTKSPYANYENDKKLLDSLLLTMDDVLPEQPVVKLIRLAPFNPNKASQDELEQVGFPTWLATRLINYRATGARFNKPEDLLKLYGFPESLYAQLVNYVVIVPLPHRKPKTYPTVSMQKPPVNMAKSEIVSPLPVFDLNTADTAVFQTIKGIGSKLSNRIVTYRNALGGFVSKDQLYQVYGLDSVVIGKIVNISMINPEFAATKINVNKAEKKQLASHPYVNWNQAKLIIAYRNQHGFYTNPQDLLKVYSINESWVKKVAPYLTF